MGVISNLKSPLCYTFGVVGVIYYLEKKMNIQVLDNFGIVVEKCSRSIRGLLSKVMENKNKEKEEFVPENDEKEDSL